MIPETTIGNHFLFTGRRLDNETGLYNYRARYYDAEIGRFLSNDPMGYWDSMNLYGYCNNNSTNFVDPYGLKLRLIGTAQEVERMRKYLSKMAGTKVKLCEGGGGYVSGDFSSPSGFEEIERRLKEIISHDEVIELGFGDAQWHRGGSYDDKKAVIDHNIDNISYDTAGDITTLWLLASTEKNTGEAAIAHEVLGHGYDQLYNNGPGKPSQLRGTAKEKRKQRRYWEHRAIDIANNVRSLYDKKDRLKKDGR